MEDYKIIVSASFHLDLKNIVYYISHKFNAPFTATELLDEIERTASSLSIMPYRFVLVKDSYLKHKEIRKCSIKNYIIFYKIDEKNKKVLLHRILHARQNWEVEI